MPISRQKGQANLFREIDESAGDEGAVESTREGRLTL